MVQLGNFHIGKAETAKGLSLSFGEVHTLWNYLTSRYKCIEKTQLYQYLVHDPEFKFFITKEMENMLEPQAREMEEYLAKYGIALPQRPPKSVSDATNKPHIFTDKYIFNDLYVGCENYIHTITHAIITFKNDDALRKKFMRYLTLEIEAYDDLNKFGKVKGWLEAPPMYNVH